MNTHDHTLPRGLKNPNLTTANILNQRAPMRSRPGSIEKYPASKIEILADRIGVDADDLLAIIESGLLVPSGEIESSRDYKEGLVPFDGHELDKIRRAVVLAGMGLLENSDEDDSEFSAKAMTTLALSKTRTKKNLAFSSGDRSKIKFALQKARAGTINFSASKQNNILMQVGAKAFGIEFSGRAFVQDEGGVPLTGKVVRDKFVKKLRDDDLDRRDANILRSGVLGAGAAAIAKGGKFGKLGLLKRAAVGAAGGAVSVVGVRAATDKSRDLYGERSRGAKKAESTLPAVGALAIGGALLKKRLTGRVFSRAEKDVLFSAYQEQTGRDLRCLQSAYTDPDVIEFAIAGILPLAGKFLRGAGRQLLTPGTTVNTIGKAAATTGAIGAVGGGIQGAIDEDSSVLGGMARGAVAGATVGAGIGAVKSVSPELMRRAKSYFRKAGPLQTPSGPAALKQGPRFRWSGPSDFDVS